MFLVKGFGVSGWIGQTTVGVSGPLFSVYLVIPSVYLVKRFGVAGQEFGVSVQKICENTVQHVNTPPP